MTIRFSTQWNGPYQIDGSVISGVWGTHDGVRQLMSWLEGWDNRLDCAVSNFFSRIWDDVDAVAIEGGCIANTIYVIGEDKEIAYTVEYEISPETL